MGEPLELLHKNKADSVFKNCKIYTSDVKYKWADRFAVKGDKFIAVGSEHTDYSDAHFLAAAQGGRH